MNGLDYNTQREELELPEYGRHIYDMIQYAIGIENREERQACAESIINTMRIMHPELKTQPDAEHKLWDHLAIMSDFRLDIDYPFDVEAADELKKKKPQPMKYPDGRIRVKHYGSLVFQMIDELQTMPHDDKYEALLALTANQMKRDLLTWGHTSSSEERVIDDLARFSEGKIQLDPNFKFERMQVPNPSSNNNYSKKKKR